MLESFKNVAVRDVRELYPQDHMFLVMGGMSIAGLAAGILTRDVTLSLVGGGGLVGASEGLLHNERVRTELEEADAKKAKKVIAETIGAVIAHKQRNEDSTPASQEHNPPAL